MVLKIGSNPLIAEERPIAQEQGVYEYFYKATGRPGIITSSGIKSARKPTLSAVA